MKLKPFFLPRPLKREIPSRCETHTPGCRTTVVCLKVSTRTQV
uniref:Uncharacterized protein n=1 Tax=Anguilla anguilla TaxID=7936 RepID=A0A0E9STZ5_ANGAN